MLQVSFINENKELVLERLKKRNLDATKLIDQAIELDKSRRETQTELDNILAESNSLSKQIGHYYKTGDTQKANLLKEETILLKERSKELSEKLNDVIDNLNKVLHTIPNVPHESVPSGTSDKDNEEVFRKGEIPELGDDAKPHWELAKDLDIIDFELGNKITGAGFPVYKGKGAKLQRALISYFLDKNIDAGYTEYQLPLMVNEDSGFGTGQLPDKEGQMYHVVADNLYLIPTAEVPATNIYRDSLLKASDLPIALTGYTPCFRREAGSYGSDVRGLNRLHQFDKVEILRIENPERSYDALDEMVEHVKSILNELKLPYRTLKLCGGDLGFTSALTYDFEVYSAAQKKWLEISSVSNFETFQANRLKLRFKDEKGKKQLCHTLNGSSLALPRVVAAIIENGQENGKITIPEALTSYAGFSTIS